MDVYPGLEPPVSSYSTVHSLHCYLETGQFLASTSISSGA